ncbi:hypothetical protein K8O92_03420 [Nocardia asteroides]|nr:hypothetical protein K8O92_03420 [Nocardia asteroides]
MTAAYDYEDLHRLVDRLTPDQAHALRAVASQLVVADTAEGAPSPSLQVSGVDASRLPA